MSATIRYISTAEVHAALPYPALVEALKAAFAAGATEYIRALTIMRSLLGLLR